MSPDAAVKQEFATLEVRRIIRAPRERVFQAWTSPADVKRWSAPGPIEVVLSEIDLRVGGRYRLEMREPNGTPHDAYGEYREVDPPRLVVYTWNWVQEPDVRDTVVTVEFHDLGANGTEVVLRHEGLTAKQAASHTQGWTSILEKLGDAVSV
jgi:uncharacterized protein YndB with AHSA1/START domain